MIDNVFKQLSIAHGLQVPDREVVVTCKKSPEKPGLHETMASSVPHRWKEMRGLHRNLFRAYMRKVEEYEIEILNILSLPDIDRVRMDFNEKAEGEFNYTPIMINAIMKEFEEWETDLTGLNGIYPSYQLQAFSIGLKRTLKKIMAVMPPELSEYAIAHEVIPALTNPYLEKIITDGTLRIKTRLAQNYLEELKLALKYMAKNGKSPVEVARMIHGMVGEGQAWYWLRIARSESVLAAEAAYDAQADAEGIPYDEWSCAANACDICSIFCGKLWKRGEGPTPVEDTHPHCVCCRVPIFNADKPVQNRWTRDTPYDNPYAEGEIQNITESLL